MEYLVFLVYPRQLREPSDLLARERSLVKEETELNFEYLIFVNIWSSEETLRGREG